MVIAGNHGSTTDNFVFVGELHDNCIDLWIWIQLAS